MAIELEPSNVLTIIYFTTNILLLIILAVYSYRKGEHSSVKSKSYIKDVWSQRKIYAPILIHFYDTATDFGVVYHWYFLMKDEHNYGSDYYTSVNMNIYFWSGITFLVLYRLVTFCAVIFDQFGYVCCFGYTFELDAVAWYDPVLIILDLYILKAVYLSFKGAQYVIEENKQKRNKKKMKRLELASGKREKQIENIIKQLTDKNVGTKEQIEYAMQNVQNKYDIDEVEGFLRKQKDELMINQLITNNVAKRDAIVYAMKFVQKKDRWDVGALTNYINKRDELTIIEFKQKSLDEYLTELGLPQYINNFTSNGFNDLNDLKLKIK
eukprot:98146_1